MVSRSTHGGCLNGCRARPRSRLLAVFERLCTHTGYRADLARSIAKLRFRPEGLRGALFSLPKTSVGELRIGAISVATGSGSLFLNAGIRGIPRGYPSLFIFVGATLLLAGLAQFVLIIRQRLRP
jgi:hypothetical protein